MASVSWASAEIEPKDIAPVTEPFDDFFGRHDFVDRDRPAVGARLEGEQAAQLAAAFANLD